MHPYTSDFPCMSFTRYMSYLVYMFMSLFLPDALAPNIYKCELCKVIFPDQMALIKHYRSGHVMPGFGEELLRQILHNNAALFNTQHKSAAGGAPKISTSGSNKTISKGVGQGKVINNVESTIYSLQSSPSESTSKIDSENEHQDIVYVVTETGSPDVPEVDPGVTSRVEGVASLNKTRQTREEEEDIGTASQDIGIIDGSMKENNKEPEKKEDVTSSNGGEEDDFIFILKNVVTNSKSFSYARLWFQCFHCPYKTQAKTALVKHMGNLHKDLCNLHKTMDVKESDNNDDHDNSSNSDGDVKVMKMSTYERIYCSRSVKRRNVDNTTKKRKRKRNLEKQDLPGTFPCKQCNKVFGRLRYLRKHVATHRTERKYLCDECGKGFTTKTYLTHHRKSHVEKVFRCSQCEFTSHVGSAVHAHRQVHTQGSILCDICGLAYADKSALNKHKRVHDPKRPYSCSYSGCQWRFRSEVMCKAHIRAHTSEGKFACTLCGYVFRHKHHLQRHELKVHGSMITKAGYQGGTHSTETQVRNSQPNTHQ